MNKKLQKLAYHIENQFLFTVLRHGLAMMIPFILAGGVANALMHFPVSAYQNLLLSEHFSWFYSILDNIYEGTFGLFSVALVIALSVSFSMEKNEPIDKAALYVIVSLGAYGAQLNIGSSRFRMENVGVTGCFAALAVTLFSCFLYSRLKKLSCLSLQSFTPGMESICANAIATIFPLVLTVSIIALLNQGLVYFFGVYSLHELVSNAACSIFEHLKPGFTSGFLYTVLLHVLWFFGFHGSHILEPVAQTTFAYDSSSTEIFSKSFFDTYVVMGGCGTTLCAFLVLLFFFRKNQLHNLAKAASFTVIFNLNEVLNFGIPIILNPILAIPFLLTPILCYTVSYGATALGFVPPLQQEISWSTPVFFSGYLATGSVKGSLLQLICICMGMAIYLPFLKLHKKTQEMYAKDQLALLVKELQTFEEENETPDFLNRMDRMGLISRMLLSDLTSAIAKKELYLLYQPQMDNKDHCIGAEALLRWNHPLYGFIYPPLIIYLAKQGNLLPDLERQLLDMAGNAIRETSQQYDGDFKISVNITSKSLLWDIEGCIDACLKKYGFPAEKLWLEITEQDILTNTDLVIRKLSHLKELGHTLLIDDFGMGHTSLIYLQSNYFNVVKLDGSLVKKMLESKTSQKIISSIVELGQELSIDVIAEYVETEEHRRMLEELGCRWYQGYLFSKPVSLDEFIAYLKEHSGK